MQFSLEELIPQIWKGIASQLKEAGEVEPHALVGNTETVESNGIGHVQLGVLPKEMFNAALAQAVTHMDADFVVMIYEAWMRKSNTADISAIPTKLVGTWPNVERVPDVSGMETVDSVVVTYVAKGGAPVVETMALKRSESGQRSLQEDSHYKVEALSNRFLDGLFPAPASKVH